MNESILVIVADILVLTTLVVIKTFYFYRATRKRRFKRWIHFNQFEIMDASTPRIRTLRIWQNVFSVIFFILLIISAVIIFLVLKGVI